jgi:hypothetical protein
MLMVCLMMFTIKISVVYGIVLPRLCIFLGTNFSPLRRQEQSEGDPRAPCVKVLAKHGITPATRRRFKVHGDFDHLVINMSGWEITREWRFFWENRWKNWKLFQNRYVG